MLQKSSCLSICILRIQTHRASLPVRRSSTKPLFFKPTYLSCRHEGFQFKQTFVGDICVPESGCQNISNICCINLGNRIVEFWSHQHEDSVICKLRPRCIVLLQASVLRHQPSVISSDNVHQIGLPILFILIVFFPN